MTTSGGGGTTLLLIDVQKSFHPGGSLGIPGADEDASRIADLVRRGGTSIDRIVMTMDTHQKLHIAHPGFWVSGKGDGTATPEPFTIISCDDVRAGTWRPRPNIALPTAEPLVDAGTFERSGGDVSSVLNEEDGSIDVAAYCVEYTRLLEKRGRFKLCVWPEHCLVGTNGHCVVDEVLEAVMGWTDATGKSVEWVHKGMNLLTESYSSLAAEVPICADTSLNDKVDASLRQSGRLLVAGQALSHCVNYTARDVVERWPEGRREDVVILTDCSRSVPGFEDAGEKFLEDMKAKGVTLSTAAEAAVELTAA